MHIFNKLKMLAKKKIGSLSRLSLKRKLILASSVMAMISILAAVVIILLQQPAASTGPRGENRGAKHTSTKHSSDKTTGKPSVKQSASATPKLTTPQPVVPPPPPPLTPASILNLTNWKLTLPINTAHAGSPDEITQPELATFSSSPYFRVNDAKNGVVFQAPVGGATTSNSGYPRSELREMTDSGKQEASWSSIAGTHTMTVREAITHLPVVKPALVAAQIHDASDDVIMIYLQGSLLYVEAGGKNIGTLDTGYGLGTPFTVQITATDGHITVFYNGAQKVDYLKSSSGYYFKAGCYTQSNPSKGDSPAAYGEVVIYSLQVAHT